MKEFQYGNACGPDLWRALEKASSLPVHLLMQSWDAVGLPGGRSDLVERDDGAVLSLRQERFFSDAQSRPSDQLWAIPMTVRYADDEGVKTTASFSIRAHRR